MTKTLDAISSTLTFIILCAVITVAVPIVIVLGFIWATLAYAGSGRVR